MKPLRIEYTPDAREEWRTLTPDQKESCRRLIQIIKARGGFDWGYGFGNRRLRYVASDEVPVLFRVVMHSEGDHCGDSAGLHAAPGRTGLRRRTGVG